MSNEEAIAIIHKEYLCVDRDCDIERSCGKCDLMMPSKEPILEAYKVAIKALSQQTDVLQVLKEIIEEYKSRGAFSSSQQVKYMEEGKQVALVWVLAEIDKLEAKTRMESEDKE